MLTLAQATVQLKSMVAWQVEPRLSEDDITVLLLRAAVLDVDGLRPSDDGWTATYSPVLLNAAAAEGWRWKAGRLTADKSGNKGEQSFSPELQRADMLKLAEDYQKRVIGASVQQPFARLRGDAVITGGIVN